MDIGSNQDVSRVIIMNKYLLEIKKIKSFSMIGTIIVSRLMSRRRFLSMSGEG